MSTGRTRKSIAPAKSTKAAKDAKGPKPQMTAAAKQTDGATKTSPKNAAKTSAASKKRKAEDEAEEKPQTNGVKRVRADLLASPAEPPKRKTAAPKTTTAKKTKAKAEINHAPTEKLNVYVFGEGSSGELGLGSAKGQVEVKRPRYNPNLDPDTVGVVAVSVGGMHTAALTHDSKIYTWGVNDQGALGRDTTWDGGLRDMDANEDADDSDSDSGSETAINPKESTPGEVDLSDFPEGIVFTQLACTDSATFALTSEGDVYGWGTFRSNEGIFGFDPTTLVQLRPKQIKGLSKITQLAAGANHVLALQSNGTVYGWGSGQQNQLGRRILERRAANSLVPTHIGLPKGIIGLGAGAYNSFAIRENGDVYSWGLNNFGQTGIPKEFDESGASKGSDVHHPIVIESLHGKGKVTCIQSGAHHTVAVTDKGELLVWGRLDGNQLGIKVSDLPQDEVVRDSAGHPRILTVPTQIPDIHAVYAAAGSDHCIAIDKNGKAYSWGFSTTFQTGLGTDDDVEVATLIDNTAVRDKKLVWAGAGGQFSVIAGLPAPVTNGVNGHA
ncbi:regulator of chromosome condensation 1/beta-lactamase-inhibitor protein II [Exophiala viscosa]|uniref:Regulator of chromosome condensation 1/beta-lactamase-inhibitor protein II n=2 Tax=Exophiala viscosa TaxID=2486360 RepID=A0AAN6IIJ7_9EURO|nr:regulator of chromosome condensation 1/beta-lactamase-inhibitor protein II [Exophiala viscosa]